MFTTLDGSLMKKAFLDDVILMHTTRALAAGDLSEEGGVRRRVGDVELAGGPRLDEEGGGRLAGAEAQTT